MADENRRTDSPLGSAIREEGYRFSFFQALRLIQQLRSDAPRVGHQGPPGSEAVRIRPSLNLGFPSSDVARIRELPSAGSAPRFELTATFLGLYGADSPLPVYFTEDLFSQEDDSLQREFLDLFHHRIYSLLYRVWEKYRYAVQFSPGGTDFYSRRLLSLLGLDLDLLPKDHRIAPLRLVGLAGVLTQIPHSAACLRSALADFLETIPVRLDSCIGQNLPIPADQRNRLGRVNCALGTDLSLGERVFDLSCTFRLGLGPLGRDEFLSFLPIGPRMAELRELVDLFNGDGLDYEVELDLREEEVPPLTLAGPTAMLGWSTWLGTAPGMDTSVRFLMKGWFHGRG